MKHRLQYTYLLSILTVGLVTALGAPLHLFVDPINLVMFYLLGVVITALWLGRGPSILTAVLSVLALDVVFIPPRFTLGVQDAQYLLTFVGLLVVGLVISALTARAREQTQTAQQREKQAIASYHFSQDLASATNMELIANAVLDHSNRLFNRRGAVFLLDEEGALCRFGREFDGQGFLSNLAGTVLMGRSLSKRESNQVAEVGCIFVELRTAHGVNGLLALELREDGNAHTLNEERLIEGFASQTALALERMRLAEKARRAEVLRISKDLQDALLNSISHDLRTPLASITGALSSLQQSADALDEGMRQDLIETAWEEANRLNVLVGNLLDMTRLEAGAMQVKRELCDPADVIGVALTEMSAKLTDRPVEVRTPEELLLAPMDFVLMVQVLVNLLDNAVKYSPPGTPITIEVERWAASLQIRVADRGIGVPAENIERIFEKFYRGPQLDSVHGTGLGLSICKGIIDAHGGQIAVTTRTGGGALFTLSLPLTASYREEPSQETHDE